jgi:hypothetical protein
VVGGLDDLIALTSKDSSTVGPPEVCVKKSAKGRLVTASEAWESPSRRGPASGADPASTASTVTRYASEHSRRRGVGEDSAPVCGHRQVVEPWHVRDRV